MLHSSQASDAFLIGKCNSLYKYTFISYTPRLCTCVRTYLDSTKKKAVTLTKGIRRKVNPPLFLCLWCELLTKRRRDAGFSTSTNSLPICSWMRLAGQWYIDFSHVVASVDHFMKSSGLSQPVLVRHTTQIIPDSVHRLVNCGRSSHRLTETKS